MNRSMLIKGIREEVDNIEMENSNIEDSLDAIRKSQEEVEMSMTALMYHITDLEDMENGEEE